MKTALVDISFEVVGEVLSVMKDHDLNVIGVTEFQPENAIRFIIEGYSLPDECDVAGMLVTVALTQRTLGKQRLIEITEIKPAGRQKQRLAA